ncbi:MAG TPA: hypothetical protein VFU09_02680 [Candidatus Udaeobacter sp.]|nr:hypothetical protein [Candidatus Udaeobacter sp.]
MLPRDASQSFRIAVPRNLLDSLADPEIVGRVGDLKNFAAFKAAFVSEADAYSGITGSLALNSAGDRVNGDFDFWSVRSDNWVRIGTYDSSNGQITIFP